MIEKRKVNQHIDVLSGMILAKSFLVDRGWGQGIQGGRPDRSCMCVGEAIQEAFSARSHGPLPHEEYVGGYVQHNDLMKQPLAVFVAGGMQECSGLPHKSDMGRIVQWNDDPNRTEGQVLHAFDMTIQFIKDRTVEITVRVDQGAQPDGQQAAGD